MDNCNEETQKEFLDYLTLWWKKHILIEDMKYKNHLQFLEV